jgi:RHH-type proline utilization regulon transcriptional repressor/proline dehydrogenase/delta 1-pyrroline-5-carboxylate dehydrogenase
MFKNEPFTDFTIAANRDAFRQSLEETNRRIVSGGLRAEPLIEGRLVSGRSTIPSVDPAAPHVTIGPVALGETADADRAMASLKAGFPAWSRTPFTERCAIIRAIGEKMRHERLSLATLIVREAGKPWKEADADVAEAIDFCDYYAAEMLTLGPPRLTQKLPGENNHYYHVGRGVVVVISPWNFPLAIACGMTVAALVTGNTAVLKPAEQTSLIAAEFARIVLAAGVPPNAFAFLPGAGEVVGRHLVAHPDTAMICFTGSKSVGLEILKSAATIQPGQEGLKRVVAELSGKNAVIVDEDADLDEAIKGVLYSAFGFSGQKCSACSRCIIVGDAYEPFMERLVAAAADLIIGPPSDSATLIGPVIDAESQDRIMQLIGRIESSTKLAFKGQIPAEGFFVPPTIFRDVDTASPVWREEVFGPVVGCCRARDFAHALELANDSVYALTGGIFSRSPTNIECAVNAFRVGNLYINRGCTGAMVGRQPFGGFKMSGIGAQAGGPDYLPQFLQTRTVCENTMRRGFAPAVTDAGA